MKGVQCYELFVGIALKKSHIFIFISLFELEMNSVFSVIYTKYKCVRSFDQMVNIYESALPKCMAFANCHLPMVSRQMLI